MEFYKMHGCGNDFIVIEYDKRVDYSKLAVLLCDRKLGIGADGLIIVKKKPLEMIFYNQDGSRASMCGNGIRCFARYVFMKQLVKKSTFDVLTLAGIMRIKITSEEPFSCMVEMGRPLYNNQMIHVNDNVDSFGRILTIKDYHLTIYSFYMGTIHTVIFVEDLRSDVLKMAKSICENSLFKAKTNVNFVHVIDNNTIELKTYERGVGWTLACGTGACASVVAAHRLGLTTGEVLVKLVMGELKIRVDRRENVFMEGPASISFIGETKECL